MKIETLNWRPVRHDELRPERIHDPYQATRKYADGTRCPECRALFHDGRWTWSDAASEHEVLCPACHRIRDELPAGFVILDGDFATAHRDEILNLVRHLEQRERREHPLQRIMAIEETDGGLRVTTTDIHLARDLGAALHAAYKGKLEYHYNDAEYLLRVHWTR